MNKDQHLEEQEEKFRDTINESIAKDAAIFVQQGSTRIEALAKAATISDNQLEALNDPTGVLETLAESQSPVQPIGKEWQTKAIAAELLAKIEE